MWMCKFIKSLTFVPHYCRFLITFTKVYFPLLTEITRSGFLAYVNVIIHMYYCILYIVQYILCVCLCCNKSSHYSNLMTSVEKFCVLIKKRSNFLSICKYVQYIFEINMKRRIFYTPIRDIQKKFSSLRRDTDPFWELKKVKNGRNCSRFRKTKKQILDFHCPSKILCHTLKLWNFVKITGPYCKYCMYISAVIRECSGSPKERWSHTIFNWMTFSVKFIILVKKSNILAIYKGIREDKSAFNLAKPERKSWCSSKSVRW